MVVGDFAQGTEVAVIGGGTGGYVAAIRAAQLGLEVTLIEKEYLGGLCLNWGCIPSKALIHVADLKSRIQQADQLGILVSKTEVDLAKLMDWKTGIVEKLRNGVTSLLSSNKVEVVTGTAEFQHAILATGSIAAELPAMPRDGEVVIDSRDALEPKTLPERLIVVGAGAVGLELGMVYAKLGTKVTILEASENLLPFVDADIPRVIERSLKLHGIDLILGARTKEMERKESGGSLRYATADGDKSLDADQILVAIGRRPNTSGIGLEKAGVKINEKGFVEVNNRMETSARNIYAVGDMVPGPQLAHKASYQGKVAAEVIAGEPASFEGVEVPSVIFTDPEIAWVGLTEAQAKAEGYKVKKGRFPFKALGRTLTLGEQSHGFVKIVSDEEAGTVLGVHIVGPSASDLISEGVLAVSSASHIDDLALTIHPHPTLPESIEEAAEQTENRAIHIFNPVRADR
ncbi:MAG: dihydrolipoyl dehydrogenase [Deltaproteobacteria bacterium]